MVKTKGGKVSAETRKAIESSKKAKKPAGSKLSGIGLTISEMTDTQFTAHLGRVLDRMKAKGVSMDSMKAASIRVQARRSNALAS